MSLQRWPDVLVRRIKTLPSFCEYVFNREGYAIDGDVASSWVGIAEDIARSGCTEQRNTFERGKSCNGRTSIEVKDFFHFSPPFPWFTSGEGILHRAHNGPPLLCFLICGHFGPVRLDINAVILEVAKENVIFEED
jgi:hypothetical protein